MPSRFENLSFARLIDSTETCWTLHAVLRIKKVKYFTDTIQFPTAMGMNCPQILGFITDESKLLTTCHFDVQSVTLTNSTFEANLLSAGFDSFVKNVLDVGLSRLKALDKYQAEKLGSQFALGIRWWARGLEFLRTRLNETG